MAQPANAQALLARFQRTHSPADLDLLVRQYQPLVWFLTRRFVLFPDCDDLRQVANIGLLKALRRFDPACGVRFITYATHCIRGELAHWFRDRRSLIRLPRRLYEAGFHTLPIDSLDVEIPSDGLGLRKRSESIGADDPGFAAVEARADVRRAFETLQPRTRLMLFLYFGLGYTQDEAAALSAMPQSNVSRICRRVARVVRLQSQTRPRGSR